MHDGTFDVLVSDKYRERYATAMIVTRSRFTAGEMRCTTHLRSFRNGSNDCFSDSHI